MKKFGIDISEYQKGFDYDRAIKEGVTFAIIRGAYHLYKDKCFEEHYKALKARKIPVGVYHYSTATTTAQAIQEADFLIENVLKGKTFEYPIYMDVEDSTQKKVSKKVLTDTVLAFCDRLRDKGYLPGLYTSLGFLNSYLDDSRLSGIEKWIAQWASKCQYSGDLGMWQFGGESNYIRTNKVAGVVCDQNYCYKDYPAIVKDQGLNGFDSKSEPAPSPEKKLLTVDGKWGSDTTRRLQEIFGTTVDGIVSNQLKAYQKKNPGLVTGWQWKWVASAGSPLIKAMQKWAGMAKSKQDGRIGPATIKAFQKKLGTTQDGVVSNPSAMVKALQKWANKQ